MSASRRPIAASPTTAAMRCSGSGDASWAASICSDSSRALDTVSSGTGPRSFCGTTCNTPLSFVPYSARSVPLIALKPSGRSAFCRDCPTATFGTRLGSRSANPWNTALGRYRSQPPGRRRPALLPDWIDLFPDSGKTSLAFACHTAKAELRLRRGATGGTSAAPSPRSTESATGNSITRRNVGLDRCRVPEGSAATSCRRSRTTAAWTLVYFLHKYRNRIRHLHVKGTAANGAITDVGTASDITDWKSVFRAATKVDYYHFEYDLAPAPVGRPHAPRKTRCATAA